MEIPRRNFLSVATSLVVTRLIPGRLWTPITVMEDLEQKGVTFTTLWDKKRKAFLVTSVILEDRIYQNLEFTILYRGERIRPEGETDCAETFLIIPKIHQPQWVSDGIRVL